MIGQSIHLGYRLETGEPVAIPLRNMVVTGQTQEAGKTTTLEALINRSGLRALAFVTKRGEGSFDNARVIRPFFHEQADWQFVASILEASRGERMKFERAWIIRASRGAQTLREVQVNVRRLMAKAKGLNADVYLTLDAYLDVVVPVISEIEWAPSLELEPGVNVVDLSALPGEMQHLVIKSSLDAVLQHERNTVVVIPEAWKFIPQGRGTPVKLSAESYIRQGSGIGNYLWLDSQDIGGVEKTILRSCPVWVLGVQREINEIKRTLANIPEGIEKPKAKDIAVLDLGQFIACWKKHTIPTYVQPTWLSPEGAIAIARGTATVTVRPRAEEPMAVSQREADLQRENNELRKQLHDMRGQINDLQRIIDERQSSPSSNQNGASRARSQDASPAERPSNGASPGGNAGWTPAGDEDALFDRFRDRLLADSPTLLKVLQSRPAIQVEVVREVIHADGKSIRGRIARLIADGFFEKAQTSTTISEALVRSGWDRSNIALNNELKELTEMGFFTRDNKWFTLVAGMEVNVITR